MQLIFVKYLPYVENRARTKNIFFKIKLFKRLLIILGKMENFFI